ncbi:MAG: hypothetical protein ACOYM2_20750 [Rectinemataceae bacterium]
MIDSLGKIPDYDSTSGSATYLKATESSWTLPDIGQWKNGMKTATFTGWNSTPDGTGTNYVDKASVTVGTRDLTLYAQWTVP